MFLLLAMFAASPSRNAPMASLETSLVPTVVAASPSRLRLVSYTFSKILCMVISYILRLSTGEVQPGCCCEAELVDEIVAELKARQRGRGDTAQIERAEQTLEQLELVNTKLDAIMKHLNMKNIPASEAMER